MSFKQRLRRLFIILVAGFALLFLGRLIWGYSAYPDDVPGTANQISEPDYYSQSQVSQKKNYATAEYKYRADGSGASFDINQKYEKIANVTSSSLEFTDDEKKIRSTVEKYNAIIQAENMNGNEGNRSLLLVVGVQPDSFDTFCDDIKKIGKVASINVSKVDKTNDFLTLKAQRASLESTRQALMELKNKPGSVDEMLNLQSRIQNVEEELQQLGVDLGEFDELNSFCTVNLTLREAREVQASKISLTHRISVALSWSVWAYASFLGLLILGSLAAFCLLLVADKLSLMRKAMEKFQG